MFDLYIVGPTNLKPPVRFQGLVIEPRWIKYLKIRCSILQIIHSDSLILITFSSVNSFYFLHYFFTYLFNMTLYLFIVTLANMFVGSHSDQYQFSDIYVVFNKQPSKCYARRFLVYLRFCHTQPELCRGVELQSIFKPGDRLMVIINI